MARQLIVPIFALLLSACGSSWSPRDVDGDGISPLDGDCWDAIEGPAGSGLKGADIHPGAVETWYDGFDQDCGGDDDYDADGDGFVPEAWAEMSDLPAGDCWDLPDDMPAEYTMVDTDVYLDKNGGALDWAQPTAADVNPDAEDTWYDGVDQDCAGDDDFDQDGDSYRTEAYPDQSGAFGDDCIDLSDLDDENIAGTAAAQVNPAATEEWYDGTDQDCDDNDCDKDGDGFDYDGSALCERQECDDDDPEAFPNGDPEWVWYDGQDNNCDGNEGDQDGDGYWVADYAERVAASGSGYDPQDIPTGMGGDCWDVPLDVEDAPEEYQALNGFSQPDAEDVFPSATDAYYDAVDQDCAGGDDFDQDGDGHQNDAYADREGVTGDDCDDEDGGVYPGYFENWYDGTDQDCDGNDGDVDGDGYWHVDYDSLVTGTGGTPLEIPETCGYDGLSSCAGDCDDGNADVHPDRLEDCGTADDDDCDGDTNEDLLATEDAIDCTVYYLDQDRDTYGTIAGTNRCLCEPDTTRRYTTLDYSDCDDSVASTYPGAEEFCDGVDSDCDGTLDEDDATDALTWYADTDNDTYGDPAVSDVECYQPTGYVLDNTDCDDGRALSNPAATEYCNDHDDDCDGTVDEDDADDASDWFRDADSDSYGNASISMHRCYVPTGYVADATDCDDSDSGDYPGATEDVANGDDEDCDGVDSCYQDLDGDNYGTSTVIDGSSLDCTSGTGAPVATDCDDADALDYPGATETVGNEDDEDCDGREVCYQDTDDDGYLLSSPTTRNSSDVDCTDQYEGRASDPFTDCDDTDAGDYPGAPETVANGDDEDCDGGEICYADADHDNYRSSSVTLTSADADCSDTGEALSSAGIDCLDSNADAFPGSAETDSSTACMEDADGDGYGDLYPPSGVTAGTDCDDAEATDHPGATETVGNEDDEDCNGHEVCFDDDDDDGYLDTTGDTRTSTDLDCTDANEGRLTDPFTDCDDSDAGDYPGAPETVGNGDDEDCDGGEICYADADHDSYRSSSVTVASTTDADCSDAGEALSTAGIDCLDSNANAFPGSAETDSSTACMEDADSDGYGDDTPPSGVTAGSDCDDGAYAINPAATETVGDGVDYDCDGTEVCYDDDDDDGYLDTSGDTRASSDLDCTDANEGTASGPFTDCDDDDPGDYPGATEIVANGDDEDCDGVDSCYQDLDNDNYGTSTVVDGSSLDCVSGTGAAVATDCDDSDAGDYPGATETVANGDDEDCDGVDSCYQDLDNDNYGTSTVVDGSSLNCTTGTGAPVDGDCDDGSASIYPGASETTADGVDQDCDGVDSCYQDLDSDNYGTSTVVDGSSLDCVSGTGAAVATDCDDSDAGDYPGATEAVANGDDEDCDGVDSCYEDLDNDNYGTSTVVDGSSLSCTTGTGAPVATDCDDGSASIYPGAPEITADGIDQDCDDGDTCYADTDGDGFGVSTVTVDSLDLDCHGAGESTLTTDCDASDPDQYPGAPEYCNGEDDDCDSTVDEDDAVDVLTWYADTDSDGYGDSETSDFECYQPTSYVADSTDCDDTSPLVHPGADEHCDGGDWDCDSLTYEDGSVDGTVYYADVDLDGYGDATSTLTGCSGAPTDYVADNSDCLDSSDITYPGAMEICGDGYGNDCSEGGGTAISDDCPAVGDLVITEIMPNPGLTSDPTGEWFEITNVSATTYDLEGLVISDNSDDVQIDESIVLAPDGVAVFARSTSPLRQEDFEYGTISLANTVDLVTISTSADATPASTDIDTVSWTASWPFDPGIAMALDTAHYSASDNDSSGNWAEAACMYDMDLATSPYYELGTPGGENDLACPVIEALDPSELALSTTPTVTLTGTDIDSGLGTVVVTVGTWGTDDELATSVLGASTLEFDAPSESSEDSFDVVLYNGINLAILEDGLNFVSTSAAYIWWPVPADHASGGSIADIPADDSSTATFYGRVARAGLLHYCDGTEPTAIAAEFGYGDPGTDPRYDASWVWEAADFNSEATGCGTYENEYMYELGPFTTGDEGTYSHTFRYNYYGSPWVYSEYRDDYSSADSGYTPGDVLDLSEIGTFTVSAP